VKHLRKYKEIIKGRKSLQEANIREANQIKLKIFQVGRRIQLSF